MANANFPYSSNLLVCVICAKREQGVVASKQVQDTVSIREAAHRNCEIKALFID